MKGDELAGALAKLLGAERIDGLRRLSGGASRETWSFDAIDADGSIRALILRRDPPGAARGAGMAMEEQIFRAAHAGGVPVPALVAADTDPAVLGAPFLVMDRLEGETIARKILRDDEYAAARPLLAAQCGTVLASIHAVPTDTITGLAHQDQVTQYRGVLDGFGQPHPAFELAFRWLEANRPPPGRTVLVHGDFRNGNLIVGPEGLRAVLDWELAHLGDPMEDLGWLCVKSWRFGAALPVGGFGPYDQLVDAYEEAAGLAVDRAGLHWWETLGTLKWGIMCIMQTWTHTSGALRSVELAAIGRRVCEVEHDVLICLERAQTFSG